MLICKVGKWRVESDGLIASKEFRSLGTLRQLERSRAQEAAREARAGAARIRELKRRALARGYAAGRARAASELVARAAQPAFVARCLEDHLVLIAMQAVSQLFGDMPAALTLPHLLRRCILASRSQRVVSVRVAPRAFDAASQFIAEVERELGAPLFDVLADASLPVHACVIETEYGVIDGSLRAQLPAIQRGMRDAIAAVLRDHAYLDGSLLRQFGVVESHLREVVGTLERPALARRVAA
jgi:type III secretion protein L